MTDAAEHRFRRALGALDVALQRAEGQTLCSAAVRIAWGERNRWIRMWCSDTSAEERGRTLARAERDARVLVDLLTEPAGAGPLETLERRFVAVIGGFDRRIAGERDPVAATVPRDDRR